jgi:hypothetical protein
MLFTDFFRRVARAPRKPRRPRRRTVPLSLEALEDRCVPSTVTIAQDNGNDNAPLGGSLREAIINANKSPGPTTIDFGIPGAGLHVITLASSLPDITASNMTIDGNYQVELDGSNAGNADGLVLKGNNCLVQQLSIVNFAGAGITVEGNGNKIEACYLGRDFDGNLSNLGNGIGVYTNQAVGLSLDGSFIEDNSTDGVHVYHSAGITISNTAFESNTEDGVRVIGGLQSREPFTTRIIHNEMDGNLANGIHLISSSGNLIGDSSAGGNLIGTDNAQDKDEGNHGDGVLIESTADALSTNNTLTNNTMADNYLNGVVLSGAGTSKNTLMSNHIGTDEEGDADEGNGAAGVRIEAAATKNTLKGNFIAGNYGNGVTLTDAGTSNNDLVNNYIGATFISTGPEMPLALIPLGNHLDGVALLDGATQNHIGGAGLFLAGKGNLIVNNGNSGVRLIHPATTLNEIQGNIIGLDPAGKTAMSNSLDGVRLEDGASNNLVGGGSGAGQDPFQSGLGNLISKNGEDGVRITDPGTTGNQVEGNRIGTDVTGMSTRGNVVSMSIRNSATGNFVGGAFVGAAKSYGNLISGNNTSGVLLDGWGTTGNVVQANEIGTTRAGTDPLPNLADGVRITGGANGNTIGGIAGMALYFPGNLISGNGHNGVLIDGLFTRNNLVEGNQIGTDFTGSKAVPNTLNGVVVIIGASSNFIGASTPGAGNLISGNNQSGVVVSSNGNFVVGNFIGTKASGLAALGNQEDGIDLLSSNNGVGRNLISGNMLNGLVIEGSSNVVLTNKIGTDATGTFSVANQQDGVLLQVLTGPGNNLVGAPSAGAGNLISGNGWNGIDITGPGSAGNQVEGNRIGTDAAGQSAVGNHHSGILIDNTTGYTIGGKTVAAGNLISGNWWDGVLITGMQSNGLVVLGNRIGTNAAGKAPVPNLKNGVHIDQGASNNLIGGTGSADGNLISTNALDGVLISFYVSEGNKVFGNRIGTDVSGQTALPNGHHGVELLQAGGNFIGSDAPGAGNLISGNTLHGVRLDGAAGNLVAGNLIGTNVTGMKACPTAATASICWTAPPTTPSAAFPRAPARPAT